MDLTVENAEEVRSFYQKVTGWTFTEVGMGGYSDYSMNTPESGKTVAGVCHARGTNAALPPVWLIYIAVRNLDESMKACAESGGRVVDGPRNMGQSRYCLIQDPAGAYSMIFEQGPE
ncbi:MAG: VOC family protein [Bryobacteraceae bacterium]